jgi:hypothetical protein
VRKKCWLVRLSSIFFGDGLVLKKIFIVLIALFVVMIGAAFYKKHKKAEVVVAEAAIKPSIKPSPPSSQITRDRTPMPEPVAPAQIILPPPLPVSCPTITWDDFPQVDRIKELFATGSKHLPIVETVVYTSRVPWVKGRPAWVADYASYYATSRHFIARSLNKKPDYMTQKVGIGSKFNVLRKDIDLEFHLLVDLSRCKMAFYYTNRTSGETLLVKTYPISVGALDATKDSGCLTPLGTFSLGDKIAIYKKGTLGYFTGQKVEMIRVFGTRWIPFDKEIETAAPSIKGLGIHGIPMLCDATGNYYEDTNSIGKYTSDGNIHLLQRDMEELFAVVITRPTFVRIVKDSKDPKYAHLWASLLGVNEKK